MLTTDELMLEGEQVYTRFCASCHQVNGQGIPPAFPSLVDTAVTTGPRDDHIRLILDGVAGSAMQAFGKQLDARQVAAVVQYERHAWGNNPISERFIQNFTVFHGVQRFCHAGSMSLTLTEI